MPKAEAGPTKARRISEKTQLTKKSLCFPKVTHEQYKNLGIPQPVDEHTPSVSFLELFDGSYDDTLNREENTKNFMKRLVANPYFGDFSIAELSMGSDDWMGMSWTYPQIETTGSFQLITTDPTSGKPMQVEVPSLKGIEKWAMKTGHYMTRRMLGISLIEELEENMIAAFQQKLLPVTCKTFEQEGLLINPKKLSSTRFHFLRDYISHNQQNEKISVTQKNRMGGKDASFVELQMSFQIG